MLSWGANSYGQLGLGYVIDKHTPTKLSCIPPEIIKSVDGGGGHTVIVTESGRVYSCGWNTKGQLGFGHTDNVPVLTHVSHLPPVNTVSCGWDFTLAVTATNEVYAWGSNVYGQLGIPEIQKYTSIPQRIQALPDGVVAIAAGLRHSVAISNDGKVWTWGSGKKGQLGRKDSSGTGLPQVQRVPEQVQFINDTTVTAVVAGSYHTAALTENGEVFMWGSNKHKQLCHVSNESHKSDSKEEIIPTPTKLSLDLFDGRKVKELHSGWTHMIAITDNQCVYSWGRCDYGQLGATADSESDNVMNCVGKPKRIASLAGVTKQLVCGAEHTLALLDGGKVLAWGWNEHGMCGDGKEENVTEPKQIDVLFPEQIKILGCGAGHCFAVVDQR
ncbi:secretion-regulating guanine nucleotide exchange factor-like [Glandiceps talaboti]